MWKMMMSMTIEKVRVDDDCLNIGIAPSFGITLWAFLEKCNSYRFGDCVGQSQGNYKIPPSDISNFIFRLARRAASGACVPCMLTRTI